jgi:predicted esterase
MEPVERIKTARFMLSGDRPAQALHEPSLAGRRPIARKAAETIQRRERGGFPRLGAAPFRCDPDSGRMTGGAENVDIRHETPSFSLARIQKRHISILLFSLCMGLAAGCTVHYPEIPPGRVLAAEVPFKPENGEPATVRFLFSVPSRYGPRHAFPLVVALHGGGDCAAAFHDLWKPASDSLGFVLLTPQGDERGAEGFGWTWGDRAEQSVQTAMDALLRSVRINRDRVFVVGFSRGGTLACAMGIRHVSTFHGFASLSAWFNGRTIPENPVILRRTRGFIGHGELEEEIGAESKRAVNLLRGMGVDVRFVSYKGVGHGLPEPTGEELERILRFLDSG